VLTWFNQEYKYIVTEFMVKTATSILWSLADNWREF
jgi:hypothetical protein